MNIATLISRTTWVAALCALTLLNTGCAVNRATASSDPTMNWSSIKSVHVAQLPGEDGSTKKLIAEKFRAKGFVVTADPEVAAQPDALVTYVDKWMWDMTMYMIELTIVVRDPKSNFPLAQGNSYHTSLTRKSPAKMVDEVVDNILNTRK
ncbi:hypothetical protein [Ferriphaselus sp. R-1]|jgi:hypothetical protein|uniref:hypothetical protein n=1 Tax=Ferriphaselus sp. R-1 TaxID=1485544 RepID=UPI000689C39C|nr:hypothetical protein [Ferriphaselus sp. R-1]